MQRTCDSSLRLSYPHSSATRIVEDELESSVSQRELSFAKPSPADSNMVQSSQFASTLSIPAIDGSFQHTHLSQLGVITSPLCKHDPYQILNTELKRREDTISKLQRDILNLQAKRDLELAEVFYFYFAFSKVDYECSRPPFDF